ncbi:MULTISPECIES: Mth938-like domain-containing protein [unclassified Nonomuraea]|uniref:Mth938-like domain-containing protein n=1 Tax=unclassified Nonomuraea TaxID=2593643 RepID=UPI0033ECAF96
MELRSPLITQISWGRTVIEGLGEGKDFKLYPGGGRPWDWNETGTRHTPGIQPADVRELLDTGSQAIVLSRGMRLLLHTCPETLDLLMETDVEIYVEETTAAVQRYNALAETIPVGGLIHSTC